MGTRIDKFKFLALMLVLISFVVFSPTVITQAYAATSPGLGTASSFSILAGSAVTNTGTTTVSGDVGISPGTTPPDYSGFGPGANSVTLGGVIHDANTTAATAQGDKNTAYATLDNQGCDTTYAGTEDLAGAILVPGVYCADSFHLTGTLTLNGATSDVWIFKSASDLILTGGDAVKVVFKEGGQPCNVWWRVVSTGTFDANSTLVGNILADTSITFAAGASLDGRALARTAAVTLSGNSITGPTCQASTETSTPTPASSSSSSSNSNSPSAAGGAICIATEITTVPTILELKRISSTSVFVSWGPYAGINTFNVRYGSENGNWLYNTNVTGFSTTINALPANQLMWFQVAARTDCNIGTYGESKSVGRTGSGNPNILGVSVGLPNTGFGPQENIIPWYVPAGIGFMISVLLISIQRKKQI